MLAITRTPGSSTTIDLTQLLEAYAAGRDVDPIITICLPANQPHMKVRIGIEADRLAAIIRDDVKSQPGQLPESRPALAGARSRETNRYAGTTT